MATFSRRYPMDASYHAKIKHRDDQHAELAGGLTYEQLRASEEPAGRGRFTFASNRGTTILTEQNMTSLGRMLSVLKMFDADSLNTDVDEIAQRLSLSRATAYRYVKELCDSGLLTRVDGLYTLGPRIIELDWMMRRYDPLISNGRELMAELSRTTGLTVYLSVFFDGHIINTHIESAQQKHGFSFGRGRPLPLFKGAQSKALVSFQKPHRLKKLYEEHIENDPELSLSWKEFNKETKSIRKAGYCITHNELNLGLTGIASPIIPPENQDEVLGSIAVVGSTSGFSLFNQNALIERLKHMTQTIAETAHVDWQAIQ